METDLIKLILESLGILSGGIIIIITILGYFGQKLFSQFLDKKIESYKTELLLISTKYQIQFTKLHNERAEVIKNVYTRVVSINQGILRFNSLNFSSKNDIALINETFDSYWTLRNDFEINKILFDKELGNIITDLLAKYKACVFNYRRIIEMESTKQNPLYQTGNSYRSEVIEKKWNEIENLIKNHIPPILDKLDDQFRELLGVQK